MEIGPLGVRLALAPGASARHDETCTPHTGIGPCADEDAIDTVIRPLAG